MNASSAMYDYLLVPHIDGKEPSKPIDAINRLDSLESDLAHQLALIDHRCNNIFRTTQDFLVEPVSAQLL